MIPATYAGLPGSSTRPTIDQGDPLKLLLTSGGVTNPSIRAALVELLGKPIEECDRARASRPPSTATRCAGPARVQFAAGPGTR